MIQEIKYQKFLPWSAICTKMLLKTFRMHIIRLIHIIQAQLSDFQYHLLNHLKVYLIVIYKNRFRKGRFI